MAHSWAPMVLVIAACGGTRAPAPAPAQPQPVAAKPAGFAVPFAKAPVLDGKIDDGEWVGAAVVPLERGVTVRFVHDGARVYLGVTGVDPAIGSGYVCVFVAGPDAIWLLHASAKLGSAIYTAGQGGTYAPRSPTYDWREADVLMRDEGWAGTTVGQGAHQELAITFARLGLPDRPAPIAIAYLQLPPNAKSLAGAQAIGWPAGVADATRNIELLAGANPTDQRFEPARWIVLAPQAR
jgi:hypothetical protein